MWKILLAALFCLILNSCNEDLLAPFNSHAPNVNERFARSMNYNECHGYAELHAPDDNYVVYVCSDTHVASSNTALSRFVKLYREDMRCPVACCLGDLVEAAYTYELFVSAVNETPKNTVKSDTLFVTPGNHDLFFNQWQAFSLIWPTSVYYFTVLCPNGKKDLFICLDSAHATLGRNQMAWLEDLLQKSGANEFRHIIVFTHVNITRRDNTYADISTFSLEESEKLMSLFSTYHVKQFWAGHDHAREKFTYGGVTYILVDSLKENEGDCSYMVLHVGEYLYNTFHSIGLLQE